MLSIHDCQLVQCARVDESTGGICPPPFVPESCNIYHFLPYKHQHQVVAVVFRVKNDHRKADYKAISKQTFELCFDRAVSGLEIAEFKGHKNRTTPEWVT